MCHKVFFFCFLPSALSIKKKKCKKHFSHQQYKNWGRTDLASYLPTPWVEGGLEGPGQKALLRLLQKSRTKPHYAQQREKRAW